MRPRAYNMPALGAASTDRRAVIPRLAAAHCKVFLDFDNTMTMGDVLDAIIQQFAIDDRWMALERTWQAGAIGSRACLTGQLRSVRVTRRALAKYLTQVTLAPGCHRLLAWLARRQLRPVIVSDSFTWIIREVLRHHGIRGVTVYANELRFQGNRLLPVFPRANGCPRCGNCKQPYVLAARASGQTAILIGDGLSDLCAAQQADVVFAKGMLRDRLRRAHRPHTPFRQLDDVMRHLNRSLS